MPERPRLETIRASILYWPQPLTDVSLVTGEEVASELEAYGRDSWGYPSRESQWHYRYSGLEGRYIRLGPFDMEATPRFFGKNYTDQAPGFWKEVLALSFAFARDDWPQIRGFYRSYGPLGPPSAELGEILGEVPPNLEPYAWVKTALLWFQKLVSLVSWCKEGKTRPLWDVFAQTRASGRVETVHFFPGACGLEIRWLPWAEWVGDELVRRFPETEDEVIWAGWSAAREAIGMQLAKARLSLSETVLSSDVRTPTFFWCFNALSSAFQAAFLQWFFQEVAYVTLKKCQACGSYLPARRFTYCSDRCEQRVKKRRDRQRLQLMATLYAQGESPKAIVRAVEEEVGVKTSQAAVRRWMERHPPAP